jgi:hypothetical protein
MRPNIRRLQTAQFTCRTATRATTVPKPLPTAQLQFIGSRTGSAFWNRTYRSLDFAEEFGHRRSERFGNSQGDQN